MSRISNRATRVTLALSAAVFAVGCALFGTPTPILFPTATPTSEGVTPSPSSPTTEAPPTDTATPTTTPVAPTATPVAPTTTAVPVTRIVFETGATAATAEGELGAEGQRFYILSIAGGQLI